MPRNGLGEVVSVPNISLRAGTISGKVFKVGGGEGDLQAEPGRASQTWMGGQGKWHSWKEKWPEQRGKGRHSETRLNRVLKSPQCERREG